MKMIRHAFAWCLIVLLVTTSIQAGTARTTTTGTTTAASWSHRGGSLRASTSSSSSSSSTTTTLFQPFDHDHRALQTSFFRFDGNAEDNNNDDDLQQGSLEEGEDVRARLFTLFLVLVVLLSCWVRCHAMRTERRERRREIQLQEYAEAQRRLEQAAQAKFTETLLKQLETTLQSTTQTVQPEDLVVPSPAVRASLLAAAAGNSATVGQGDPTELAEHDKEDEDTKINLEAATPSTENQGEQDVQEAGLRTKKNQGEPTPVVVQLEKADVAWTQEGREAKEQGSDLEEKEPDEDNQSQEQPPLEEETPQESKPEEEKNNQEQPQEEDTQPEADTEGHNKNHDVPPQEEETPQEADNTAQEQFPRNSPTQQLRERSTSETLDSSPSSLKHLGSSVGSAAWNQALSERSCGSSSALVLQIGRRDAVTTMTTNEDSKHTTTQHDDNNDSSKDSPVCLRHVPNLCAICLEPYYEQEQVTWSPEFQHKHKQGESHEDCGCQHAFHKECFWDYATMVLSKPKTRQLENDCIGVKCPLCRLPFVVLHDTTTTASLVSTIVNLDTTSTTVETPATTTPEEDQQQGPHRLESVPL